MEGMQRKRTAGPDRTAWVAAKMYDWERTLIERAAALEGVRISEFLRTTLVAAARRRIRHHDVETK